MDVVKNLLISRKYDGVLYLLVLEVNFYLQQEETQKTYVAERVELK